MRVEIGPRAQSSLTTRFVNRLRQTNIYRSATARIQGISPATISQHADVTEKVNSFMESLSNAIQLSAELKVRHQTANNTRLVDLVKQAEAESTRNIFGAESGEAINHQRDAVRGAENSPFSLESLKGYSKKALYLATASAALYGLGLVMSAPLSLPTLMTAITAASVVSTVGVFGFAGLHSWYPSNPKLQKIKEYASTWGLLGSLVTSFASVPYILRWNELSVVNALQSVPSWGTYSLGLGVGAYIIYSIAKACSKFFHARLSMFDAPDKLHGMFMLAASKLNSYFKLGTLFYIPNMYLAALFSFSAQLASSSLTGAALSFSTTVGAYLTGKFLFNINRDVKDAAKNLGLGLAVGTLPLLLLGGWSTAAAFPTLFLLAPICMLWANIHSGIASTSSATSHVGSLTYPATPPITDPQKDATSYGKRGGIGRVVIRLNAFMANLDTNFSNFINMLINCYPDVEFELCEEKKPWASAGDLEKVRAAKEFLKYWENWQKRIYDFIHAEYQKIDHLPPQEGYSRLARVFERIGKQLSEEKPFMAQIIDGSGEEEVTPFLEELFQLYEEDALSPAELKAKSDRLQTRTTKQKWFNHELAPVFFAEGFQVMKDRARSFFFPLQKTFEERAKSGKGLSRAELKKEYLRLLDIYSVKFNYIIRRLEHHDDQTNQKTNNLMFAVIHAGDTLYQLFFVSKDGKQFYREYIPSTYIRVNNPEYEHNDNAPKYLWIARKDAETVNEPLKFSQSGSEEIEFIDNTPDSLVEVTYKGKKMKGLASNVEALPAKRLILRDFEKEGTSARDRLQDKLIWMPGTKASPEFEEAFKTWRQSGPKNKNNAYVKAIPEGKLWYEDPEVLVLRDVDANDYWFVADEEYIDFASAIQLQAELQHDSQQQKILRLFRYMPQEQDIPYPCPERPIEHILHVERIGAPIEISYFDPISKTQQMVPYQENRSLLITDPEGRIDPDGTAKWTWKDITHAEPVMEDGKKVLKLYAFRGKPGEDFVKGDNYHFVCTIPEDDYPDQLPPPNILGNQRLTFNVFSGATGKSEDNRVGIYGYYMYDFGETTYGKEPWQRYRFAREPKKPWQLWWNLVESFSLSKDKKTLKVKSSYPEAQIVPFNSDWAYPGEEEKDLLDVIETSPSRERWVAKYKRENGSTYYEYAPSKEQLRPGFIGEAIELGDKSALALVKFKKDGKEFESILPLTGDLKGYADPAHARDVLLGQFNNGGIEVIEGRQFENNPETAATYLYTLKNHAELVAPDGKTEVFIPNYGWIKDTTIKSVNGQFVVSATLENPFTKERETIDILGSCFVDNEGVELLKNNKRQMDSILSFFRKEDKEYPTSLAKFRPELSIQEGLPILRLHTVKKERKTIELSNESKKYLAEILPRDAEKVEVYIASPTSAVKVKKIESRDEQGRWVPLSLIDSIDPRYLPGIDKRRKDFAPGKMIVRELVNGKYVETVKISTNIEAEKKANEKIHAGLLMGPDSHTKIAQGPLAQYFAGIADRNAVIDRLNGIIARSDLRSLATGIELSSATKIVLKHVNDITAKAEAERTDEEKEVLAKMLPILNRLIIEDLYPQEIKKVYFHESHIFKPNIMHGDFGMIVHRQNSFGGLDAAEVRDDYFYARHFGPGCEIRYSKGEFNDPRLVIGLQCGKNNIYDANRVSRSEAIENGTPFMATFRILMELAKISGFYDEHGKLTPANVEAALHHPFAKKIVTFLIYIGCLNGVSEDEELKKVMKKAIGRMLRYSSYPTAVVAQPNLLNKIGGQNYKRYNTSAVLFDDIELGQVARELWHGWIKHDMPMAYRHPKELLETVMTGLWYPGLPWAELGQMIGPTAYLFSGGSLQPYIVDHILFLSLVFSDTSFSGLSYGLARYHGGFSPAWSFWHAPSRDPLAQIGGYWEGSRLMKKQDWQYGQFIVTAEQKEKSLPIAYHNFLRFFYTSGFGANALGLASLAAILSHFGVTGAFFPMVAILLNNFFGLYKVFMTKNAKNWLDACESDLKENSQDIAPLIASLEATISDTSVAGREKIFSLLNARQRTHVALRDLGFDAFEVKNGPSRNEDQLRQLLHTGFVLDNKLLEAAKELGKSKELEDRLIAMTMLKHLGTRSFSHDVGVLATRAYKRVVIDKSQDNISAVFANELKTLENCINNPSIDLHDISTHYFIAATAWDQLTKAERKQFSSSIKYVSKNLAKTIAAKITSEKIEKVDDLNMLAGMLGQIQPFLPLLGKKGQKLVNQIFRAKVDAFLANIDIKDLIKIADLDACAAYQKELHQLYALSNLGSANGSRAFKLRILDSLYHEAEDSYGQASTTHKEALAFFQNILNSIKKNKTINPATQTEITKALESLIKIRHQLQSIFADSPEKQVVAKNEFEKALKDLAKLDADPKKLEEFARKLIEGCSGDNYKSFADLLNLQKEKALLALDKKVKAEIKDTIKTIITKQLEGIRHIKDAKLRMQELQKAIEILTGYAGHADQDLSFKPPAQLEFIFNEIIPEITPEIVEIIKSCGSVAQDLASAKGETPGTGTFLDRAMQLRQWRENRKFWANMLLLADVPFKSTLGTTDAEKTARGVREDIFNSLILESMNDDEVTKAITARTFNNKLGALCNKLIDLLTDFRSSHLAEKDNGIIDFIQTLLVFERESLLKSNANADAKKAYLDRVRKFKAAAKIFVDKKYSGKPMLADYLPTASRDAIQPQKSEINYYFHYIKQLGQSIGVIQ